MVDQTNKQFNSDPEVITIRQELAQLNKLLLPGGIKEPALSDLNEKKRTLLHRLNNIRNSYGGGTTAAPAETAGSAATAPQVVGHYDPAQGLVYNRGTTAPATTTTRTMAAPALTEEEAADPNKVDEWFEAYKKQYPPAPAEAPSTVDPYSNLPIMDEGPAPAANLPPPPPPAPMPQAPVRKPIQEWQKPSTRDYTATVPTAVPITEMQWQSPQEVLKMHTRGVLSREEANRIIADRWPDSDISVGPEPAFPNR